MVLLGRRNGGKEGRQFFYPFIVLNITCIYFCYNILGKNTGQGSSKIHKNINIQIIKNDANNNGY